MKKICCFLIFLFLITFANNFSLAQDTTENSNEEGGTTENYNSIESVTLENPLGENEDVNVNVFIGGAINAIMGVVGSLFLLFFVVGGLMWMTSAGNSEKVEKAKSILIWNAFGMIVIFASYGIIRFIFKIFE